MAKILIVEDDEMLMDLMQQTLELSDHVVRGAINGVDALAHVGVRHIDIPITPWKVWSVLKEKGLAAD